MTTAEILLRLQNVSQVNGGWQATCPAHPDSTPSLSISEGAGGKTLLICHAGCKIENIVAVMGLQMSDLFPPSEKPKIVEIYDYQDAMGNSLSMRFSGMRINPGDLSDSDFRFTPPPGSMQLPSFPGF